MRAGPVAVEELLPGAERPAPMVFQRTAAAWLDRKISRDPTVNVDGLALGVLSALRGPLVIRCGAALRDSELLVRASRQRVAEVRSWIVATRDPVTRISVRALNLPGIGVTDRSARERVSGVVLGSGWRLRQWLRTIGKTSRPQGERPYALFLPRMPVHLVDLVPVAQELEQRGFASWFSCMQLDAAMRSLGLAVETPRVSLPRVARLALEINSAASGVLEGPSVGPEARALTAVARSTVREMSFDLATFALGAARMLQQRRPRIVVVGNPYSLEGRTAALLSRSAGLKSAALEHGLSFEQDPNWGLCASDRVCCWGSTSHDALRSSGVRDEQLVVTGAPRLDRFLGSSRQLAGREVLVATSGGGDQVSHADHERFIDAVYEAAAKMPDVLWTVKLHPKDREALYAQAAERRPSANVRVTRGDAQRVGVEIYEFLSRARVLVTVVSATALDALAVGVPVISVQFGRGDRYPHFDMLRRGALYVARSADDLAQRTTSLLAGLEDDAVLAASKRYAEEQFAHRGDATRRVASELIRLGA